MILKPFSYYLVFFCYRVFQNNIANSLKLYSVLIAYILSKNSFKTVLLSTWWKKYSIINMQTTQRFQYLRILSLPKKMISIYAALRLKHFCKLYRQTVLDKKKLSYSKANVNINIYIRSLYFTQNLSFKSAKNLRQLWCSDWHT